MNKSLLALLAAAAAAAGCGNGGSDSADSPAVAESSTEREPWDQDASAGCDLVLDDEVRTALGEAVTAREEGGFYGCRWTTDSNLVSLRVFPDTSLPAGSCDESQSAMPYGQSAMGRRVAVTDLGESAIWGTSGDLLVCTGRGLVVVDLERTGSSMTQDAKREAAMLIAGSALSRLETR